ncbi:hypothetical protein DYB31_014844 [Aphanomyces astaci]|uniref:Uncharacterized protein n=1 Tax=Aphanomyces astaci TaxID=112090 RepID=A0A397ELX9_APHAT|nr:hypothetical protein DYB31_014844 [Aphanomyces astaci]
MHTHGGGDGGTTVLPELCSNVMRAEFHLPHLAMASSDAVELLEARAMLLDMHRTCSELKHKVRSLEGAKLLWEITRMSMEFQAIKDLDETHRLRSALEDELILVKYRARHFEQEHNKLLQDNSDKDRRLAALEAKLSLLGDTSLVEKRIEDLETQVKELDKVNKEHAVRERELMDLLDRQDMRGTKRQFTKRSSSRSLLVREIKQELWSKVKNPVGWLLGGKAAASSVRDITCTFPDLELLDLLKREVPKLNLHPQYNRHSIS